MASAKEITNKDGVVYAYQIRVYRGRDTEGKQLKPYSKTWRISYTIFPCLDNDTISITADSFSDLKRKIEAKNDTPDIHRSNMLGQIEIMKELLFSF